MRAVVGREGADELGDVGGHQAAVAIRPVVVRRQRVGVVVEPEHVDGVALAERVDVVVGQLIVKGLAEAQRVRPQLQVLAEHLLDGTRRGRAADA